MYWRREFPSFSSGSREPDTLSNPRYFCFQHDQIVVPPVNRLWQPFNRGELLEANAPIVCQYLWRLAIGTGFLELVIRCGGLSTLGIVHQGSHFR